MMQRQCSDGILVSFCVITALKCPFKQIEKAFEVKIRIT